MAGRKKKFLKWYQEKESNPKFKDFKGTASEWFRLFDPYTLGLKLRRLKDLYNK